MTGLSFKQAHPLSQLPGTPNEGGGGHGNVAKQNITCLWLSMCFLSIKKNKYFFFDNPKQITSVEESSVLKMQSNKESYEIMLSLMVKEDTRMVAL